MSAQERIYASEGLARLEAENSRLRRELLSGERESGLLRSWLCGWLRS